MSALCPPVASLSEEYRADRLTEADRREFRAHLLACEECRRTAIRHDPAILFALASAPPVSDDAEARAILEHVKAALAVRDASRKLDRSASERHGRRAAAAVGAAALIALTFSAPLTRRRPPAVLASRAGISSRIRNAATKIVRPGADEPSLPSSATIYEWNPGAASPDDPKIVWIVDRSLDL